MPFAFEARRYSCIAITILLLHSLYLHASISCLLALASSRPSSPIFNQYPFIFYIALGSDLVQCIVVEDPRTRVVFGVGRHGAMLTNLARITASTHPAHVEDNSALYKNSSGQAV